MATNIVVMFDADGNLVNTMGLHADLASDCMTRYILIYQKIKPEEDILKRPGLLMLQTISEHS